MNKESLRNKAGAALAAAQEAGTNATPRTTHSSTSPGAIAFMQPALNALTERAEEAEAKVAQLESQMLQSSIEIPLDQLVDAPGRRRKLTPSQFSELKANLANNPLIHPVSIRKLSVGRYEIVSGSNRVAVYRDLGRPTIPAVILDLDDNQTHRAAFYANLLQPDLPDYEKYLGFKHERDRTKKSQKDLATEAGVSEAFVSMLFSFEQLPRQAIEAIEASHTNIGIHFANDLVKALREGNEGRVVEAVNLVLQGKLTQKEAAKYAEKLPTETPVPRLAIVPMKIKAGKKDYCEIMANDRSLRVTFKTEQDRKQGQALIETALRELAQQVIENS